jgi:hypothetical protein
MFHPAISAAMAHERHTELIKAATRRRSLRAAKATMPHKGRRGR